jgi:hypothetical protein
MEKNVMVVASEREIVFPDDVYKTFVFCGSFQKGLGVHTYKTYVATASISPEGTPDRFIKSFFWGKFKLVGEISVGVGGCGTRENLNLSRKIEYHTYRNLGHRQQSKSQ